MSIISYLNRRDCVSPAETARAEDRGRYLTDGIRLVPCSGRI
jgi:hypothetical protein